jgi:hypothetical protein
MPSSAQWAPVAAPAAALASKKADGRSLRAPAAGRRAAAPLCSATQQGKRSLSRTVVMPRRRDAGGDEVAAPRYARRRVEALSVGATRAFRNAAPRPHRVRLCPRADARHAARLRPPDAAESVRNLGVGLAAAGTLAAFAAPPDVATAAAAAAGEFAKSFFIGGFAAAVGCAPCCPQRCARHRTLEPPSHARARPPLTAPLPCVARAALRRCTRWT